MNSIAAADKLALVGTTIAEKYDVQAVADAGGTAIVYRAFHRILQRRVALKVFLTPQGIDDASRDALRARFVQEGRVLAELSERTSAVLQARDIGTLTTATGEWLPFMVLEWLEGATLEKVLEREATEGVRKRDLRQAMVLLEPVAMALGLAHRLGIAHRDVKPSNLFVVGDLATGDVTIKLLDFGIAKVVEATRAKTAFNHTMEPEMTAFTPAYGAPEQFSRAFGATGPWTDVFALALVLLEIVSGQAPLAGDTIDELGASSTKLDRRPSLPKIGKAYSPQVEAVFARAVCVEPAYRYPTVDDFWNELRAAATPSSPPGPLVPYADDSSHLATTLPTLPTPGPMPYVARTTSLPLRVSAVLVGVLAAMGGFVAVMHRGSSTAALVNDATILATVVASAAPVPVPVAPAACPEGMLPIPAASFFMGSDEKEVEDAERPAHRVTLHATCIDRTEVTASRYAACVESGRCAGAWDANAWPGIAAGERRAFDPLCNAREPTRRGEHPANCVTWTQARDFCAAEGARLPTEAEWELAARGTDGRRYPWGDAEPTSKRLNACGAECGAWGRKHGQDLPTMFREDDGWPATAPVGSFSEGASPYGLLDMTGNVWEWVADRFGPYDGKPSTDPQGPAAGDDRVMRGGAWNGADASWVRPTYRFHASPTLSSHGIGFRCAKPAP